MAEGPAIKNTPEVNLNEIDLRSKTAAEDLLVHADLPTERSPISEKPVGKAYRLQQAVRTPTFLDSGFEPDQDVKTSPSPGIARQSDNDFKSFTVSRGSGTVLDNLITGLAITLRVLQEKIISFLSRRDNAALPNGKRNTSAPLNEEQALDEERALRTHTLEEAMFMSSKQRRKFRRRMSLKK